MSGRTFLDTNVLVYAFDRADKAKRSRAIAILSELDAPGDTLVLSTQVLSEFYVTVTRKLARPLPEPEAERAVNELSRMPVVPVDAPLVQAAVARSRSSRISYWDALIVEAASVAACDLLLTEDLQHGQQFGRVKVTNPFLPPEVRPR